MNKVQKLGNLSAAKTQSRTVYSGGGIAPTLCSGMDHGNTVPYVIVKHGKNKHYKIFR